MTVKKKMANTSFFISSKVFLLYNNCQKIHPAKQVMATTA